jgi:branched-chain amino acid transport system permease protein
MKPLLIAGGLALALVPIWALESFHLFQLTLAVIMALAVLGLNVVTGYNGQISLGHGAFFAVGAYATAIPMSLLDWSFWATLPVSALVCGVVGWGVGFPALRLGGLYLALTTFALAVAVPQILKHKAVEAWTGGVQGLFLLKPEAPAWLALSPDQYMYVVALLVAGFCYLLTAKQKIPAVFVESVGDQRLAQQIARESGAKIGGSLYSDSLSAADGPAATLEKMFRHNIDTLIAGLRE